MKMSRSMDVTGLILAASKGDLEAFNRLVLTHQDMIYNQAYRMMGESDAAADATQETFISAYNHLHRFRGGSFRAWLLRIVTNTCYDELRRRKRQPVTPLEPLDDAGGEIESPYWMVDPNELPEERTARRELEDAIQGSLNRLSPEYRAVVILVDLQGFEYAEAAEVIGKPIGTVKSRLARGRAQLRESLRACRELWPDGFYPGEERMPAAVKEDPRWDDREYAIT